MSEDGLDRSAEGVILIDVHVGVAVDAGAVAVVAADDLQHVRLVGLHETAQGRLDLLEGISTRVLADNSAQAEVLQVLDRVGEDDVRRQLGDVLVLGREGSDAGPFLVDSLVDLQDERGQHDALLGWAFELSRRHVCF